MNWLNEFRFGWSSIKFFMTPIDYLTNPANAVGLPGINLNDATSAFTQFTFQNIRNLVEQPAAHTNQNDFQIFDNVTWVKGKHTVKRRQPHLRSRGSSTPTRSPASSTPATT